jgi:hypothetical protein
MSELENIVRPFQTNEVTPAQTYYLPGQIGLPNVTLRLGRGGSGKVLTGSYSYTQTFYCVKHEVEKNFQGQNQETGEPE